MKSPCLTCAYLRADKNNPTCDDCAERLAYVASIERGPDGPRDSLSLYGYELPPTFAQALGAPEPLSRQDYLGAQI